MWWTVRPFTFHVLFPHRFQRLPKKLYLCLRFEYHFLNFKVVWRCVICLIFITFSMKLLLSHINRMHSRSPDFRLLCGIDGCTEEYRVYNSFCHHVKRRHSQHLVESTRPGGERPREESQGPLQQQVSNFATISPRFLHDVLLALGPSDWQMPHCLCQRVKLMLTKGWFAIGGFSVVFYFEIYRMLCATWINVDWRLMAA